MRRKKDRIDSLLDMHNKTKKDLKETRTLLFILLASIMAVLGLIVGIIFNMLL
jgi:hypothetical protein